MRAFSESTNRALSMWLIIATCTPHRTMMGVALVGCAITLAANGWALWRDFKRWKEKREAQQ